MDLSFVGFLGTVLAIGMAVALPIVFVLRARGGTRTPPIEGGSDRAELEAALREQGALLDEALRRVGELEERVDFTERLLAQREPPALPGGPEGRGGP